MNNSTGSGSNDILGLDLGAVVPPSLPSTTPILDINSSGNGSSFNESDGSMDTNNNVQDLLGMSATMTHTPTPSTAPASAMAVPASMPILLVPQPMITAKFGESWGRCSHEKKEEGVPIRPSASSLLGLKSELKTLFAHVESISATEEAIYSATCAISHNTMLLHIKLEANTVVVTLRGSSDIEVGQALICVKSLLCN